MTVIEKIRNSVECIQIDGVPYFDAEYWQGAVENLTQKDAVQITQGKKFPLVLLLLTNKEKENYIDNDFREANVDIFLFNDTQLNYSVLERETLTMPILREIESNMKNGFKWNGVRYNDYNREEIYLDKTKKNKLDSIVDAIHINITDFKYQFTDC